MLGALIGGIGSIISGIAGANAANAAAEQNWQANLLNYFQREQEREDAVREGAENKRIQREGFTDADGNRSRYVEGRGWVAERSSKQDKLAKLQQQEQLNVLQQDLPRRRRSQERNETRARDEDLVADTMQRRLKNVRKVDDKELADMLFAAATRDVNESYDNAIATASREGARTQSSNSPKVIAELNAKRSKSMADARMDAMLRARGQGQAEYDRDVKGITDLYNLFASRASIAPDVSYRPENIDANSSQFMATGSSQAKSASEALMQALAREGGTLDYIEPNYGMANAIGGGSSALASMFRGMKFGGGKTSSMDRPMMDYNDRLVK
jgi:hypothetical protein